MMRLAEYMRELADMLGEIASVHFVKLERGSTVLVHRVDREAIPKVRERISSVRQGDAPPERLRAFGTINSMLREDNAVASYEEEGDSGVILQFPGREQLFEKYPVIKQQGFIDGVINSVGGKDEPKHVRLEIDGRDVAGCYTTKAIAKQLGNQLWEPVRLYGRGSWRRDADGNWELLKFKIEGFEPLERASLSDALTRLRKIPTEWDDNSYTELIKIRNGDDGSGRH
jgi:hypothetical protein